MRHDLLSAQKADDDEANRKTVMANLAILITIPSLILNADFPL